MTRSVIRVLLITDSNNNIFVMSFCVIGNKLDEIWNRLKNFVKLLINGIVFKMDNRASAASDYILRLDVRVLFQNDFGHYWGTLKQILLNKVQNLFLQFDFPVSDDGNSG